MGEGGETWIKPRRNKQDGRVDFKDLQYHYRGEGKKTVQIKEARVLRNILYYKNERDASFEKFLTYMQSMFTGFEENG